MYSANVVLNSLCFVILMFLCTKHGFVKSENVPVCSEKSSLMPYDGSCSQSSQCITNSRDIMCFCPVNTHFYSSTASCVLDCNATATSQTGQIVSPNYPNKYPNSNLCTWTLTGTSNSYYVFSISDMDIENNHDCSFDSLKIYDGTSDILLAKFCNTSQTTINVVASTTNSMNIVFMTDGSVVGKGFNGSYRIFGYNTTITEPPNGYIASPGYPLKSAANSFFSWTIRGRPGSFISLSIRNLTLEPAASWCYDYVQVYDGNNSDTRILYQMCSNMEDQRVFTSTGFSLYVVFRSASSIDTPGFLASYEINDFGDTSLCDPQAERTCSRELHFECRQDKQGVFRCLCTSGMFSDGTYCLADSQLAVVLNDPPQILIQDVTFNWTSHALTQLVAYTITWVATKNISDRGEKVASSSGVQVQGLTPGTEYNFTVLSILEGNDYYNDSVFTTHFNFETLTAERESLNVPLVAGVTAASGVVLIVGAVIVTLGIRKRRRNRKPTNITDNGHHEIVISRPPTLAASPAKTDKSEFMDPNVADIYSKVNKSEVDQGDYISMTDSPADLWRDDTSEYIAPTNDDDYLDVQDDESIYDNNIFWSWPQSYSQFETNKSRYSNSD